MPGRLTTTASSTLLHAAIVYTSPQLREFDNLAFGHARCEGGASPAFSSLPPEILLMIRAQLVPLLMVHFLGLSTSALHQHEESMRDMLCPQCSAYNEYVYGRDVWTWPLSGPCSCVDHCGPVSCPPRPSVNQFRDRLHWLETYLSTTVLHFASPSSDLSSTASRLAIWDAVDALLEEHDCEITARRMTPFVVLASRCPQSPWRMDLLRRDFGLDCYADHWQHSSAVSGDQDPSQSALLAHRTAFISLASHPGKSHRRWNGIGVAQILETVAAPVTAVVSVLVSSFTLFVVIVCFYSRPSAFRVL